MKASERMSLVLKRWGVGGWVWKPRRKGTWIEEGSSWQAGGKTGVGDGEIAKDLLIYLAKVF